jgi:hypothetical protein
MLFQAKNKYLTMKAAILLLLMSSMVGFGSAFVVTTIITTTNLPSLSSPRSPLAMTTTSSIGMTQTGRHLNEVDEMCIENVAEMCLDMECDVEEYEALVNSLEEQHSYHMEQVALTEQLLQQLRGHQVHGAQPSSTSQDNVLAA